MSSGLTCHHCGSSEFETDQARGDTVCTKCGIVIEDNVIVNEIQFEESSFGATHVVGQRITYEYSMRSLSVGGLMGSGKQSRQITLENAKKKIKTVGNIPNLNSVCIEQAFGFYKMALNRRLTHGRKNSHVIAACVYMVCRLEFTPHILLDLSDVMQVNVYDLGKTYLKLSSVLCLNIPPIDPCIYIMRYAHKLGIKEKSNEIQMTALRLVSRMKRDWMHTGRRPSGLCGAALLVSARLHGMHCSIKDVIKVVKVCETTIRKRLNEFGDTPSSKLTLEEFLSVDLEGEEDPPCYKTARKKNKEGLQDDKAEKNPVELKEELNVEIEKLQKKIDEAIEKSRKKLKGPYAKFAKIDHESEGDMTPDSPTDSLKMANDENELTRQIIESTTVETIKSVLTQDSEENFKEDRLCFEQIKQLRPTAKSLGLNEKNRQISANNNYDSTATDDLDDENNEENNKRKGKDGKLYYDDLDDDELDSYLLSQKEIETKTNYWLKYHAEYLREVEEKERKKKLDEELRKEREAKGEISPKKKRKSRKRTQTEASSAGEAIEKMLLEKKISNKINYDVLRKLTSDLPMVETVEKTKEDFDISRLNTDRSLSRSNSSSLKRLPSIRSQMNLNNSSISTVFNSSTDNLNKIKSQSIKSKLCSNLLSRQASTTNSSTNNPSNNTLQSKSSTPTPIKQSRNGNESSNKITMKELEDSDEDDDEEDEYNDNSLSLAKMMSDNLAEHDSYEVDDEYAYEMNYDD